MTSKVNILNITNGEWEIMDTVGDPPLGVCKYSCTAIGGKIYYFGGWCYHDNCYHNSLHELDTFSLTWRELSPNDNRRSVMKRGYGGLISLKRNHLLMVGGIGSPPITRQPTAQYHELPSTRVRTNEQNLYYLLTGEWISPTIVGEYMPPTSSFTADNVSSTKAIIFGGLVDDGAVTDNVYILEMKDNIIQWNLYVHGPQAPVGRYFHAATAIATANEPMLMVIGGKNSKHELISDSWVLNIDTLTWEKLDLPHVSIAQRCAHSLSSVVIGKYVLLIVVGGGINEDEVIVEPHCTSQFELLLGSKCIVKENDYENIQKVKEEAAQSQLKHELHEKKEELDLLQTRFLDLRVQIQTMKDEKEHIILDHKIEIERLKIQLRNAQEIIDQSNDNIAQLESQLRDTQGKTVNARGIESEGPTSAFEAFKKKSSDLINATSADVYRVTDRLFSESLIDQRFIRTDTLDSYHKARNIIHELCRQLEEHQNPNQHLKNIVTALCKLDNSQITDIANSLL